MSLSDAERDALEQLQEAIENGDLFLLRKLLNQTDLTNYPFAGPEDRTLLHVACSLGERECVVALLMAGADPNAVDDNGSMARRRPRRRRHGRALEGAAESSAARSSLATMSRSAGRASSGPGAIMMMSMLSCGAPGAGAR